MLGRVPALPLNPPTARFRAGTGLQLRRRAEFLAGRALCAEGLQFLAQCLIDHGKINAGLGGHLQVGHAGYFSGMTFSDTSLASRSR
jgi:hypothetical protein